MILPYDEPAKPVGAKCDRQRNEKMMPDKVGVVCLALGLLRSEVKVRDGHGIGVCQVSTAELDFFSVDCKRSVHFYIRSCHYLPLCFIMIGFTVFKNVFRDLKL